MNYQNGDIVRLRSGSPDMVIISVDVNSNLVQVAYWSTTETKIVSNQIPMFALEMVRTGYIEEETEVLESIGVSV